MGVAPGTVRHLDVTVRFKIVGTFSLVFVLYREAFNHSYISFFIY